MSAVFSRQAKEHVIVSASSLLTENMILGDNPLAYPWT